MIYLNFFFNCIAIDLSPTQLDHSTKTSCSFRKQSSKRYWRTGRKQRHMSHQWPMQQSYMHTVLGDLATWSWLCKRMDALLLEPHLSWRHDQPPMKWSYAFEDGKQALPPMQVPAGPVKVALFLLVELKKAGGKIGGNWQINTPLKVNAC